MSDELRLKAENAFLTQALLSGLAATNAAFAALLAMAEQTSPQTQKAIEDQFKTGVDELSKAIAFIKEARHVGHNS